MAQLLGRSLQVPHARIELVVRVAQRFVDALLIRDITNAAYDGKALGRVNVVQVDVHGKLAPVRASAREIEPGGHRAQARLAHVLFAPPHVTFRSSLGYQDLDGLADQLVSRIAEQGFDSGVQKADLARFGDADHAVGHGFHEMLELLGVARGRPTQRPHDRDPKDRRAAYRQDGGIQQSVLERRKLQRQAREHEHDQELAQENGGRDNAQQTTRRLPIR